jgi:hypothetical protein
MYNLFGEKTNIFSLDLIVQVIDTTLHFLSAVKLQIKEAIVAFKIQSYSRLQIP